MKGRKLSTPFIVSICLIAVGLALCCWGAWVPPKGEVNGSLLKVFGMAIGAAGLLLGMETAQMAIEKGTDASVKMGNTEVTINSPDSPDGQ
mgnify:CR=1 FL=1